MFTDSCRGRPSPKAVGEQVLPTPQRFGSADELGQILADDWTGIGYDGKKATKEGVLADLKSGKVKLESVEFGL